MAKYYYDRYTAVTYQPNKWYKLARVSVALQSPLLFARTYYANYESSGSRYIASGNTVSRSPGEQPVTNYYYESGASGFGGSGHIVQVLSDSRVDENGNRYRYGNYIFSKTVYDRGSFLSTVVAEDGTYPINGRHTDGYWYVRGTLANSAPTITLATTDNRTLYENDTFGISGLATDTDNGNVVSVKYQINGGTTRAIATQISTGAEFPFNRSLTFKESKLFDGATAVTSALAEGTQHVLTVWAEDDQGGKSAEQTRTFYVVPNRPPKLTVDPITPKTDMIDSDTFEIKGTVNNPDANGVKVHYKIGNTAYQEVYSSAGAGGAFSFRLSLSQLSNGANSLTVRATDHFGAVDTKTITITKADNVIPLKTAVTRYKMLPPNGTAKGVLLWIEREVGDLVVDARISMTSAGEPEHFVPMTKNKTAFVSEGIEEDEYLLDAGADKSNIILEITQKRTSTASEKGITKITGVFA